MKTLIKILCLSFFLIAPSACDDCPSGYDCDFICGGDAEYDCNGYCNGGVNYKNPYDSCEDCFVELWNECYNINETYLNLNDNQLTGSIPYKIEELFNLKELYLSYNQLTGAIPYEIGNLTNLTSLNLYGNQLTGEIPPEIGNLTNLEYLYLGNNQLSGEIPEEICNQGDSTPSVGNNQLCPPYPDCISQSNIDSQDTSNCP